MSPFGSGRTTRSRRASGPSWLVIALVLILVPVAAGAGTLLIVRDRPLLWHADRSLVAPRDVTGLNPNSTTLYATDFANALGTDAVVSGLVRELGITRDQATMVSAAQDGKTSMVVVHSSATSQVLAERLAAAAATDTYNALAGPTLSADRDKVADATNRVAAAEAIASQADAAVQGFLTANGLVNPEQEYTAALTRLAVLQDSLNEARLSGDLVKTRALQVIVTGRQAEVTALAAKVRSYEQLVAASTAAQPEVDAARQNLESLRQIQAGDSIAPTLTGGPATKDSRLAVIGKPVGVAVALALVVLLAWILLPRLLRFAADQPVGDPRPRGTDWSSTTVWTSTAVPSASRPPAPSWSTEIATQPEVVRSYGALNRSDSYQHPDESDGERAANDAESGAGAAWRHLT